MSNDTRLDTTIREPSIAPDEAEMLLFALDRSRAQFAWKVGGLGAEALNRPHPPSAMTLGGLLKHMALVVDRYTADYVTGEPMARPLNATDDWDDGFEWRTAAHDSPEELYALWSAVTERSRAAIVRRMQDGGLDQPAATGWQDGRTPNLRRVLVDLHDEYARHVGHADLFREATDGLVGEDPPQG